MDFIDMLVNTSREHLTGYFYERRPKTTADGRVTFKYEQLSPNSRVFDTVLNNVRLDRATYALKTNDFCAFNVGGYIQTQNGLFWEIVEVVTNEQAKGENNVLRWFKAAKNAECNVRMIQVENIFDVDETYETECAVTLSLFDGETAIEITNASITTKSETIVGEISGNRLKFSIEKNTGATVSLYYSGGTKEVTIKPYQTQKNTFEQEVKI